LLLAYLPAALQPVEKPWAGHGSVRCSFIKMNMAEKLKLTMLFKMTLHFQTVQAKQRRTRRNGMVPATFAGLQHCLARSGRTQSVASKFESGAFDCPSVLFQNRISRMPDSKDGSSDSEDDPLSGESLLGHTKASKTRARAYSWSFQAEIRLDLSDAGSDPSAHIDLAKQAITASLRHEHHHHIPHLVAMLSVEEIQRNSAPIILVTMACYIQFQARARSSDLCSWLQDLIVSSSWERVPRGLC
jgi:hypothetical protein